MFVRCKAERLRVQDAKAEVRSRSGTGCAWTKRVTLQPELSEQVQIVGCSTLCTYLLATSLVLSRARVQSVWTAIALPTMTVVNHVSVLIGHRMSADTQYIEAKMTHRAFVLACSGTSMQIQKRVSYVLLHYDISMLPLSCLRTHCE